MVILFFITLVSAQVPNTDTLNSDGNITNNVEEVTNPVFIPDSGTKLLQSGQYNEAVLYYNTQIQQNPKDLHSLINKGLALNALKRYEESLQSFDLVLMEEPENTAALNNKALVLTTLGRNEEALSYFNQALEIEPDSIDILDDKGFTLCVMGKHSEALQIFQKVIQLNPYYIEAWNNNGLCLLELGRYDEADTMFNEAILLDPDDPVYWNNKGLALFNAGKTKDALSAYEMAVRIHTISHHENDEIGSNYEQSMRDDAISNEISKLSRNNPLDAKLWVDLCLLYSSYNEKNEAQAAYERAVQLDPSLVDKIPGFSPLSADSGNKEPQIGGNTTGLDKDSQINNPVEQKVTGTVKYFMEQQGWKITLPGTISGVLSPDTGTIQINSTDTVISYGGMKYPVTMKIEGTFQ